MSMVRQWMVVIFTCCYSQTVCSYEVVTHERLSREAVMLSILGADGANSPLNSFGLVPSNRRVGADFDRQRLFSGLLYPVFIDSKNEKVEISQLIQNGANYEDDGIRSLQHFYDPANDRALDVPGLTVLVNKSPDWSLEDGGLVDGQEYSYLEALGTYHLALTAATEAERNANWGVTFESLGRIIHHIQDMAQPQHVRNDVHCNVSFNPPCGLAHVITLGVLGIYDPSHYEEYSKELINNNGFPEIISLSYPIPNFDTAREFWTSIDNKGLADFTNRNFVSKDTNFHIKNNVLSSNRLYDSPVPRQVRNTETLNNLLNDGGVTCQALLDSGPVDLPANADCIVEFIESDVSDNFNPAANGVNDRAASLSLYDEYLDKYNIPDISIEPEVNHIVDIDVVPTLNKFNYLAAHQHLIPRAVAYSAGLINHFFKAKFIATVDYINNDFVIKNLSGSVMHGQIQLYVEAADTRERELSQTLNISDYIISGLDHNAEISIPIPDLANYGSRLMFVYKGDLGNIDNLDYVYGYQVDLKYRGGGYISAISTSESREGGLPDNIIGRNVINAYFYRNMRLDKFVTNFTFFNELAPSNPPFPQGTIGKYTVNNFYFEITANSSSYCIVEAIGAWNGLADEFSDDVKQAISEAVIESEYYIINNAIQDVLSLSAPGDAECISAPYGYRSVPWAHGWVSKYPKKVSSNNDLDFRVYSVSQGIGDLVQLTNSNLVIMNQGVCEVATIYDVNNSWPENSSDPLGADASTHKFSDQTALLNANAHLHINSYIQQNIADFSCP